MQKRPGKGTGDAKTFMGLFPETMQVGNLRIASGRSPGLNGQPTWAGLVMGLPPGSEHCKRHKHAHHCRFLPADITWPGAEIYLLVYSKEKTEPIVQ
jgi:hypothetical protein